MKLQAQIEQILEKGILAPSADNLQPWQFRIQKSQVDLLIDKDRTQNFCDEGLLMPYLSAGALIQNMKVAADSVGCRLFISYFPDSSDALWVARIHVESSEPRPHPHFQALSNRATNRKMYRNHEPISESTYASFHGAIQNDSGYKLQWMKREDPSFNRLAKIIGEADQIRFESKRLHRELMAILRMNKKEIEKYRDGLDQRSLEAGPGSAVLFRMIQSWTGIQTLNCFGLSRLFNFYAFFQMHSSQAAGLILAPDQSRESYVGGGEVMQKIWHQAALSGLSLQPMEALPIFILNLQLNQGRDFTEKQRTRLKDLETEFYSLFNMNPKQAIIFFFRLGYAPPPTVRSPRRELRSFLR